MVGSGSGSESDESSIQTPAGGWRLYSRFDELLELWRMAHDELRELDGFLRPHDLSDVFISVGYRQSELKSIFHDTCLSSVALVILPDERA